MLVVSEDEARSALPGMLNLGTYTGKPRTSNIE